MPFADRRDAGRRLAARLDRWRSRDVVVLAIPRGGVPVAFEVAGALGAPLDVVLVRKLGLPFQPELALGAIGEGGLRVADPDLVRRLGVSAADLAAVEAAERSELERRAARFRAGRERVSAAGRTAIVVDDGLATGSTARVAVTAARAAGAARVVVAVPVGAAQAVAALHANAGGAGRADDGAGRADCAGCADEVVCLECPPEFTAVGQWYADFSQTPDEEVTRLLAGEDCVPGRAPGDEDVTVFAGAVPLAGRLTVPDRAAGVVVFAHGSGSERYSPRARSAADTLHRAGIATLLVDLLTPSEEADRARLFAVELLANRLVEVTRWVRARTGLPVGYYGTGTGAAAALCAATDYRVEVAAVVARGGRPDLAGKRLGWVRTPTLLIAGAHDTALRELHRDTCARLPGESRLAIVPGATQLFEEPGALDAAACLARDWYREHLTRARIGGAAGRHSR
ncbi:phosphoribosyltransferase family protein [Amycolatopsis granulosa]|uniref:phosphoribosyltransferase family protein n=1 Tax=Amycolatopsis granulosa TaxID=185684 RepID=UPI00142208B9|nr:phosphoribosyltransferase family protein [Amycolatopsis granulosa]NIH83257.1 putative phosphoribosyl transferase [Amycolatopsis granulosa]